MMLGQVTKPAVPAAADQELSLMASIHAVYGRAKASWCRPEGYRALNAGPLFLFAIYGQHEKASPELIPSIPVHEERVRLVLSISDLACDRVGQGLTAPTGSEYRGPRASRMVHIKPP